MWDPVGNRLLPMKGGLMGQMESLSSKLAPDQV
jgi:hypothetical protein